MKIVQPYFIDDATNTVRTKKVWKLLRQTVYVYDNSNTFCSKSIQIC